MVPPWPLSLRTMVTNWIPTRPMDGSSLSDNPSPVGMDASLPPPRLLSAWRSHLICLCSGLLLSCNPDAQETKIPRHAASGQFELTPWNEIDGIFLTSTEDHEKLHLIYKYYLEKASRGESETILRADPAVFTVFPGTRGHWITRSDMPHTDRLSDSLTYSTFMLQNSEGKVTRAWGYSSAFRRDDEQ